MFRLNKLFGDDKTQKDAFYKEGSYKGTFTAYDMAGNKIELNFGFKVIPGTPAAPEWSLKADGSQGTAKETVVSLPAVNGQQPIKVKRKILYTNTETPEITIDFSANKDEIEITKLEKYEILGYNSDNAAGANGQKIAPEDITDMYACVNAKNIFRCSLKAGMPSPFTGAYNRNAYKLNVHARTTAAADIAAVGEAKQIKGPAGEYMLNGLVVDLILPTAGYDAETKAAEKPEITKISALIGAATNNNILLDLPTERHHVKASLWYDYGPLAEQVHELEYTANKGNGEYAFIWDKDDMPKSTDNLPHQAKIFVEDYAHPCLASDISCPARLVLDAGQITLDIEPPDMSRIKYTIYTEYNDTGLSNYYTKYSAVLINGTLEEPLDVSTVKIRLGDWDSKAKVYDIEKDFIRPPGAPNTFTTGEEPLKISCEDSKETVNPEDPELYALVFADEAGNEASESFRIVCDTKAPQRPLIDIPEAAEKTITPLEKEYQEIKESKSKGWVRKLLGMI